MKDFDSSSIVRTLIVGLAFLVAGYYGYSWADFESMLAGPLLIPVILGVAVYLLFVHRKVKQTNQAIQGDLLNELHGGIQVKEIAIGNDYNTPKTAYLTENQSGWDLIESEYRREFPRPETRNRDKITWVVVALRSSDGSWQFRRVNGSFFGHQDLKQKLAAFSNERGIPFTDYRAVTNMSKLFALAIIGLLLVVAIGIYLNTQFGIDFE